MAKSLPDHLRALFAPREPLLVLPPVESKKMPPLTGVSAILERLKQSPIVIPVSQPKGEDPFEILTPEQIRSRKRKQRIENNEFIINKKRKLWNPRENSSATEEPYNTLFFGRLPYSMTEQDLKQECEKYAETKEVKIVRDLKNKPRGYAFVEMADESGVKAVYSKMKGKQFNGRTIVVDVERGRTVKDWKPRRFGNTTDTTRPTVPKKSSLIRRDDRDTRDYRGPGDRRGPPPPGRDRRRFDDSGPRRFRDRGDRGDRRRY